MKAKGAMGIDGCGYGYLGMMIDHDNNLKVFLSKTIKEVFNNIDYNGTIFIDMPIGFECDKGVRTCDQLARKFLGFPRSASIFNTPVRRALEAKDYHEANEINKKISGKGLSKQSYYLFDKMRDLDTFLQSHPKFMNKIHESHPEMLFKTLKQVNLNYSKKTEAGFLERLDIISKYILDSKAIIMTIYNTIGTYGVKKDDVLDTMILTLGVYLSQFVGQITVPETIEYDAFNIPMAIYCINLDHRKDFQRLSFNRLEILDLDT